MVDDFSVSLAPAPTGHCAASGCRQPIAYAATLAYCNCDQDPDEHGHPGSPEARRDVTRLCVKHGALIRDWECFESITNEVS